MQLFCAHHTPYDKSTHRSHRSLSEPTPCHTRHTIICISIHTHQTRPASSTRQVVSTSKVACTVHISIDGQALVSTRPGQGSAGTAVSAPNGGSPACKTAFPSWTRRREVCHRQAHAILSKSVPAMKHFCVYGFLSGHSSARKIRERPERGMTVAPLVLEALALSVQASSGYGLDGGGAAVPTATYRGSIDGAAEVLVSAMNLKLYNSP
jgi:hypothetical protein